MWSGVALLSIPIAVLALSCGGSSSETPWPAEPEGLALGPAGETAPLDVPVDEPEAPEDVAPGEPEAPLTSGAPPGKPAAPQAPRPAPERR